MSLVFCLALLGAHFQCMRRGGRGRPIFQNGGQSYKLRLLQRAGAAAHVYMYMCVCAFLHADSH